MRLEDFRILDIRLILSAYRDLTEVGVLNRLRAR